MADTNDFLELVKEALPGRITIEAIAYRLEISVDYAKQLRDGKHKISAPIRAKLDALIAAKANGPGEVEEVSAKWMERPNPKPVELDLAAPQPMPRRTKYQVIKVFDGYAVVENPIAVFRGLSWAEEYAHWLNDQINRGKGAG